MSNTIRRKKFNKKKHFFTHYWECYSQREVDAQDHVAPWQYHSDNYYTKGCKNSKQFFKNDAYRKQRQRWRLLERALHVSDNLDVVLPHKNLYCIKWRLH